MIDRVIETRGDIDRLSALLHNRPLPFVVKIKDGKPKSYDQDKLEAMWHTEAAEQLGDESAADKRAFAKLTIGVPVLREEDDDFREAYDAHVKGLPYETKLACMKEPLDMPCTRLMTTKQKSRYLDGLYQHYREQGVELTEPEGG